MKRLLGLLIVLFVASPVSATTYYVSKSGSNGNSCATAQSTTQSSQKLTIVAGIACLSAGDTLLVHAGNYNEGISTVPNGTSWANTVRIAAFPGDTVWLKPLSDATSAGGIGYVIWLDGNFHYVDFDGINLDGSLVSSGVYWPSTNNGNDPHHIRFQNAEVIGCTCGAGSAMSLGAHAAIGATGGFEVLHTTIHGGGLPGLCGFSCAEYGIYIQGPNNLIDGVEIYDTSGAGIQLYGAAGDAPNNNIVRNSKIHDITRMGDPTQVWGIIVIGSNNQIYNNLIYGINIGDVATGNAAIAVAVTGNKIWNNTIYNNKSGGIRIDSSATSTEVRNNIAYLSGGSNFSDGSASTTKDHNVADGTNPLFQNAGSNDFHLTAGSPAHDTGTTLANVTTDIDGLARPQPVGGVYDIGAYEYFSPGSGSSTGGGPGNLDLHGRR